MRKSITIQLGPEAGRDKGKMFVIKEMPASQGENWAYRAIMAIGRSNSTRGFLTEIPDEIIAPQGGWAALAMIAVRVLAGMNFDGEAKPLLDEMMSCVRICRDPMHPETLQELIEMDDYSDIEEISSRLRIRLEWWKLHTSFFFEGNPSGLESALQGVAPFPTSAQTSPTPSEAL